MVSRPTTHRVFILLLLAALLGSATLLLAGRAAAQSGSNGIDGFILNDLNGNDIADPGVDAGIPGVTLTLQDASGAAVATTTTDASGEFMFSSLATGVYTVSESVPAGFSAVDVSPGTAASVVSLTIVRIQMVEGVTTYAGTVFLNRQAGASAGPNVIKGLVINDLNGNGMQDVGEPWVNGVAVTLQDAAGSPLGTRFTSGFGQFAFAGLAGGTYTLRVNLPAGVASTAAIAGDGAQVVDASTIRITTSPGTVTYGGVFLVRGSAPVPVPPPVPPPVVPPVPPPGPSLAVTADKPLAVPGDLITYTLTLSAGGTGINGGALYDLVPAGTQFVDASSGGRLWGDTLAWSIAALSPGTSTAVSFRVRVSADTLLGVALQNQAQFALAGQAFVLVSSSGAPVVALPGMPLTLLTTVDSTTARSGSLLTYRLTYRNVSAATVGSATVVDPLPAGLLFVDADAAVQYDPASNTVRFSPGDLAPGAAGSLSLRARVDANLPAGTVLSNQARIEAPGLLQPIVGNAAAASVQLAAYAGTYKLIQNPAIAGMLVTNPSSITVDAQNHFTVITVPADQPSPSCLDAQGVLNPDGSFGVTTASGQVRFTGRVDPVSRTATLTVQRAGFVPFPISLPQSPDFNPLPDALTGSFSGFATNSAGDGLRVRLTVDPGGNATFETDLIQLSPPGIRCRAGAYQVTATGELGFGGQAVGQLQVTTAQPTLTYNYVDPDGYQSVFQVPLTRQ